MANHWKLKINVLTDGLLLVNLQKAHLLGGSMSFKDAGKAVAVCRQLCALFDHAYGTVLAYPYGSIALASSYRDTPTDMQFLSLAHAQELQAIAAANPVLKNPWDFFAPHVDFMPDTLARYLTAVAATGGQQQLHGDYALADTTDSEFVDGFDGSDEDHPEAIIEAPFVLGHDPLCDAWSAFKDRLGRSTGVAEAMREDGVKRVLVGGIPYATYIARTVMDGLGLGFEMVLVEDACAGTLPRLQDLWNLQLGMRSRGALVVSASVIHGDVDRIPDLSSFLFEHDDLN